MDQSALAAALSFLRTRARFESEVRLQLAAKGFVDEAEPVIAHLRERRIVDDARLIENLIERKSGKRAVGKERMRAELLRRGAPEEKVDAVLSEIVDGETEINELLRGRFREGDSRAKAGRFLGTRGFETDEIEAALNKFFGNE